MDDIIDATFYQDDDFLTRTLTSSVLYDKSNLDLSFGENNNNNNNNNSSNKQHHEYIGIDALHKNEPDSPNLDFLKMGSPDLEQMLFNINDSSADTTISNNEENLNSTNFSIDDDLVSENCFTDALQQLHDKQTSLPDLSLLDIPNSLKEEKQIFVKCEEKRQQHIREQVTSSPNLQLHRKSRAKPSNKTSKSNAPSRHLYNNKMLQNNVPAQQMLNNKSSFHRNMNLMNNHSNITNNSNMHNQMAPLSDQMVLNNQINMMNSVNQDLNSHQIQQQQQQQQQQQHQQQQEIAFLTQAMGFQQERENMHLLNQGFNSHNQMQQKLLEQQMMQQHLLNNGYPNNLAMQPDHMNGMDSINSLGIDDQTLKIFMDNPHLAPINLEIQELIKRERKKLRNRVASSKCRKRKLEREGKLEDKVKDLKEKNIELNAIANALKQQICDLKQRVMDHVGEGCQIVIPS